VNLRAVGWIVGFVLLVIGCAELVPFAISFVYREPAAGRACLDSAALAWLTGAGLMWLGRGSLFRGGRANYFRREGLAAVGISWIAVGLFGALPFVLSGVIPSMIDATFESVSGFTTTGATILSGERIDALPRCIAFWRSMTNWLGGVGIVMVFVLFLPGGARNLYRAEVTGLDREAGTHRVRDSAIKLFRVYVALSLAIFLPLLLTGMGAFDAVLNTFAAVATGGFSNHGSSIAYYQSWVVELILVAGMFLAGINFDLYNRALGRRDWWRVFPESIELRVYAGIFLVSILSLGVLLWVWGGSNGAPSSDLPNYQSFELSVRDSAFTVASIQTACGFATADFDRWPDVCRMWVMVLGVFGGCAGSTAGGIKIVRIVILWKAAVSALRRFAKPKVLQDVRMGEQVIEDPVVSGVVAYVWTWIGCALFGTLVLAAFGSDPVAAVTGVIATLNNVGPGLGALGPSGNFGALHEVAKVVLTTLMVLGRLEFYAIVTLFLPAFWKA